MSSADCCGCSYATIDNLRACLPAAAVSSVSLQVQQEALLEASRCADTFLRDKYPLPLLGTIDPMLRKWVCWLAAWEILSSRGFNPNANQIDGLARIRYNDAMSGLREVSNGTRQLCVTTATESLQPDVGTNAPRGFGGPGGVDVPFVGPNTWGT